MAAALNKSRLVNSSNQIGHFMSQEKPTDDPREKTDSGSAKHSDTPWKQPVEKEQGSGEAKPDLEKWNDTKTH